MTALEFLRRAACHSGRIVLSSDLLREQIIEAQAKGNFWVDEETAIGWAILPWDLYTPEDKIREVNNARMD